MLEKVIKVFFYVATTFSLAIIINELKKVTQ